MKTVITLAVCVLCLCLIAGCAEIPREPTNGAPSPGPAVSIVGTTQPGPQPEFFTSILSLEQHKRIDGSAYRTVVVNIENVGDADAINVRITVRLIDSQTDRIESSKSEIYPRFNAGERKILTKDLDSVWNRAYRIETEIVFD
jgi:hypothetical protein